MLIDVESAEPARKIEIDLDGAALPIASDRVAQDVFKLGAIERAFALVEGPRPAGGLERLHQSRFRLVPDRVVANALVRPIGELDVHIREAKVLVDRQDEIVDLERLLGDLALGN